MKNTSTIKVLVSAVGGDVGLAIVKALRISGRNIICYGCDIENNEIGSLFVDSFHIVKPAKHRDYLNAISALALDLGVDAFIPASEQEITILTNSDFAQKLPGKIPIICQDFRIISTYGDKLNCMNELNKKIPLARYADGQYPASIRSLVDTIGFPLVIKERFSRGSKSINIVNTYEELEKTLKRYELPLVQEYIDDKFGEYSVGIFSDGEKIVSIAFLRNLGLTGASWYAETSYDPEVLDYAQKIARIVSPRGSINIQVRKSSKGVRLLEINPRFSSLTAARAISGFNDVIWSLDLALNATFDNDSKPIKKIRFKRYISEIIDQGDGFETIPEWVPSRSEKAIRKK